MRDKKKGTPKLPRLRLPLRVLLYLLTALMVAAKTAETKYGLLSSVANNLLYALAACFLIAAVCYLIQDIRGVKRALIGLIKKHELTNRIYSDYRYRTVLMTHAVVFINIFYALSNGFFGILHRSVWLGTLSVYYIFLCVMRSGIVRNERRLSKELKDKNRILEELRVYRNTGILLSCTTIALGGAVILLVNREGSKSYPGYLIFVIALYTFYKAIVSVVNIFRARRLKSPFLVTIRNIGYADALVSVLSLQTAMFESFGEDSSINPTMMNGITGVCVCAMILGFGVYMIISAGVRKRRIEDEMEKEVLQNI